MPVKLLDYGAGIDQIASAIPAAIQGFNDAEDRKLKRMELAAKLGADQADKARKRQEWDIERKRTVFDQATKSGKVMEDVDSYIYGGQQNPFGSEETMLADNGDGMAMESSLPQQQGILRDTPEAAAEKSYDKYKQDLDLQGKKLDIKKKGEVLSPEQDPIVSDLSKDYSQKVKITNYLDEAIATLEDPNLSDADKLRAAQQMIKPMNSVMGPNAVGSSEADRLAEALEYQFFDPTSGDMRLGRNIKGFMDQMKNSRNTISKAGDRSRKQVESMTGRTLKKLTQDSEKNKTKDTNSPPPGFEDKEKRFRELEKKYGK